MRLYTCLCICKLIKTLFTMGIYIALFGLIALVFVIAEYYGSIEQRKLKNNFKEMTLEDVKKLIIEIRKRGQNIKHSLNIDISRHFELDINAFIQEIDSSIKEEIIIQKETAKSTEIKSNEINNVGDYLISAGKSFKYIFNTVMFNLCIQILLWFIIVKGRDKDLVETAYLILIISTTVSTIFVLMCFYNISLDLIDSGKKLNDKRQ